MLGPPDQLCADARALVNGVRPDHLRVRRAALAPGLRHGVFFAGLQHVHQPEPQRVQPQAARDALHMTFERVEALRHAVAAIRAGRRRVGVDHVRDETDVGLRIRAFVGRIKRHGLVAGVAGHSEGMVAVCARVAQHAHFVRHDPPVGHDTGAHGDAHRVARGAGEELLLARILHLDRPPGCDGQVRADVLDQHFLFVAKAAADARLDDPDTFDGQAEHRREDAPRMERHLRARPDDQPVILVPVGDADHRLDGRLLHLRDLVLALEDVVRRGQRGIHVAQLDADGRGQVARGVAVCKWHILRLVVDNRRAGRHRLARVQDRGQFLVLDLDQAERALRDFLALRRDRSHAVSDAAQLAVQAEEVQRAGDRVGLARGGVHHARDVRMGQHRMDAGQCACP